eukprot:gene9747-13043_t
MLVSQLLRDHFPVLVDPQFTALMEEHLDKIAAGMKDKTEFLREFYF